MVNRAALFSRRDWVQEPGVSFSGGNWWTGFSPLFSIDPDFAICAATRLPADTTFDCDFGATRSIGCFHLQRLYVSSASRVRLRAGADPAFGSTTYDSGIVSGWPRVQEAFTNYPFGAWSFAGLAEPEIAGALGLPRWFIPASPVSARYARVEIWDRVGSVPPRVGYFGACETWEMPQLQGWSIDVIDDSEVINAEYGSRFIWAHPPRRRLNLGLNTIDKPSFIERLASILPRAGTSIPAAIVIDPDNKAFGAVERMGVFGLLSQATITAAHFALYEVPLILEQC